MKILFIHQKQQSFSVRDLNLLQERYDVREVVYRGITDIFLIIKGALWADIIFCWFAKLHAFFGVFFGKLFNKRSVVIAGGDDVAYVPEIKYGMACYWWKKWCPALVFRWTDKILSVSESSFEETLNNFSVDKNKVYLLAHGFASSEYKRYKNIQKENIIITVGNISNETCIKKGIELFVRCAGVLMETPFYVIGPDIDGSINRLREIASSNLHFTGGLYGEELIAFFNKAKVYVQVSVHESFGCSVAEAMLCECIPVVTRNGALPEVVGECGYCVESFDPEIVADTIKKALNAPLEVGVRARKRIETEFPVEKRKEKLYSIMNSL